MEVVVRVVVARAEGMEVEMVVEMVVAVTAVAVMVAGAMGGADRAAVTVKPVAVARVRDRPAIRAWAARCDKRVC